MAAVAPRHHDLLQARDLEGRPIRRPVEGETRLHSGDLVVLDPGTGGLNLFRTDGDSLEFLRQIPVPFIGDDVCF